MIEKRRNVPASVRARLLNVSKERREDFQLVLQRYAAERLLFRLGRSRHGERFVLKGAMLFALWGGEEYRSTRDLDFLGSGPADPESAAGTFREICGVGVPEDGITFAAESIRAETIRDVAAYGGVRLRLEARLEKARIPVQVDIGFGNALFPEPQVVEYPTLLDVPRPRIRAYPREAVAAEKLHAMVILGAANTRMKDFYDLYVFSRRFRFNGRDLAQAIVATFKRRQTTVPAAMPPALASAFFDDSARSDQWRGFLGRSGLDRTPGDFTAIGEALRGFLWPVLEAIRDARDFGRTWQPGGPWS